MGDPNGCVSHYGGTPSETLNKDRAHSGVPKGGMLKAFTPVPAAMQVNENTCGSLPPDHIYNASPLYDEYRCGQDEINALSFGIDTDTYDHKYADYDVTDTDGVAPRFGTDTYFEYERDGSYFPANIRMS